MNLKYQQQYAKFLVKDDILAVHLQANLLK